MKKILPILLTVLFCCVFASAQPLPELEKVRQIKLLEHTWEDVQKILAEYKLKPQDHRVYVDTFVTENTEIEVYYSEGKCDLGDENFAGWNVAEWLVEEIEITPKKKIQLKELGLNLSKFKKENRYINNKVPKLYYNQETGITLVSKNNEVETITILPPQKHLSNLCDKKVAKKLIADSKWLIIPLNKRIYTTPNINRLIGVGDLQLSLVVVRADCSTKDVNDDKSCVIGIRASTIEYDESLNSSIFYVVSAGKIIRQGKEVFWDLTGVKPGVYSITAAVDDSCGFCGTTMTKTVTVKECVDCVKP
jgi:hypothetical protein